MGESKNIFLIARRGRERDEDQLTELLAYLWQQEPELLTGWLAAIDPGLASPPPWDVTTQFAIPSGRRPDIRLGKGSEIEILVEVKIDSSEGVDQLIDYATYLEGRSASVRALIYLTPRPETIPALDNRGISIRVVASRWQQFGDLLAAEAEGLARDFFRMLSAERLVTPPPFSNADWETWAAGSLVHRRVQELLDEARPILETLASNCRQVRPLSTSAAYVYRIYTFEKLSFALGFLPGRAIGYEPIINVVALNELLPAGERRAAAERALNHPSGECDYINWGEWVTRSRRAADVLTAADFRDQVDQAVRFARESLKAFEDIGYLPSQ